ncbi:hypothetical protein ADUPG1_010353, partial [Aduncisulcus paluster]
MSMIKLDPDKYYCIKEGKLYRSTTINYVLTTFKPPIFFLHDDIVYVYETKYKDGKKILSGLLAFSYEGGLSENEIQRAKLALHAPLRFESTTVTGSTSTTSTVDSHQLDDDFGPGGEIELPAGSTSRSSSHISRHNHFIDPQTYSNKVQLVKECIKGIKCPREDKRTLASVLKETFIPTMTARSVTCSCISIIPFTSEILTSTNGFSVRSLFFPLKEIIKFIFSTQTTHFNLDKSVKESISWCEQIQSDKTNVGIMTFCDDFPLTAMAYNPITNVSLTLTNFSSDYRRTLRSRYILALVPGGKLEGKTRRIDEYINSEIEKCNGMSVYNGKSHRYEILNVFHYVHKSDSPQRHEHLGIPKPTGLCRFKCSLCSVDRDHLVDFAHHYPERTDIDQKLLCPPLPGDVLHMEGRTMLHTSLHLFVNKLVSHEKFPNLLSELIEYNCSISLMHYKTLTAHQFYELSYVLPSISVRYGLPTSFVLAA